MKKENIVPFVVAVLPFIIIVILFFAWDVLKDNAEVDELKQTIDDKLNVSSDYKQGWIDCINYLKHIRTRAANCTVAIGWICNE